MIETPSTSAVIKILFKIAKLRKYTVIKKIHLTAVELYRILTAVKIKDIYFVLILTVVTIKNIFVGHIVFLTSLERKTNSDRSNNNF